MDYPYEYTFAVTEQEYREKYNIAIKTSRANGGSGFAGWSDEDGWYIKVASIKSTLEYIARDIGASQETKNEIRDL